MYIKYLLFSIQSNSKRRIKRLKCCFKNRFSQLRHCIFYRVVSLFVIVVLHVCVRYRRITLYLSIAILRYYGSFVVTNVKLCSKSIDMLVQSRNTSDRKWSKNLTTFSDNFPSGKMRSHSIRSLENNAFVIESNEFFFIPVHAIEIVGIDNFSSRIGDGHGLIFRISFYQMQFRNLI